MTNISYIGDFFLLWPVASAYYKETGDKIRWVVTRNYYMYPVVTEVLLHQDFSESITLVDVGTDAWNQWTWRFDPAQFGVYGPYMNFGFTGDLHGKYMPDFYGSLCSIKPDNDYCIKLIDFPDKKPFDKVTMEVASRKNDLWPLWKKLMPEDVVELDYKNNPFALNLWYSAKAKERHFGCSSSAVLMDLMNLPCTIYMNNTVGDPKMFYRNDFHKYIYL